MNTDNLARDRLVRNEQLVRNRNTKAKEGIKKYLHKDTGARGTPIDFVCECSRECGGKVSVSIDAYEAAHERRDRFLVAPGHETKSVEKVVDRQQDYYVVEKYDIKL